MLSWLQVAELGLELSPEGTLQAGVSDIRRRLWGAGGYARDGGDQGPGAAAAAQPGASEAAVGWAGCHVAVGG